MIESFMSHPMWLVPRNTILTSLGKVSALLRSIQIIHQNAQKIKSVIAMNSVVLKMNFLKRSFIYLYVIEDNSFYERPPFQGILKILVLPYN